MVMEQLKNAWWEAVIDSMEAFHGVPRSEAKVRAFDLRSDIEALPDPSFEPDIIYHDEPFYVASRLAGRELDVGEHRPAYRRILERRFGHLDGTLVEAAVPAASAAGGGR